jgi:hypothetical protein
LRYSSPRFFKLSSTAAETSSGEWWALALKECQKYDQFRYNGADSQLGYDPDFFAGTSPFSECFPDSPLDHTVAIHESSIDVAISSVQTIENGLFDDFRRGGIRLESAQP